ncbi:hypothetical protein [Streptomyces cuspidosporus]|uniref:hypothetical protein n=1 Tax=Streptomyces cuspidosporus TaxID=66882 RepID=UPI003D15C90C
MVALRPAQSAEQHTPALTTVSGPARRGGSRRRTNGSLRRRPSPSARAVRPSPDHQPEQ